MWTIVTTLVEVLDGKIFFEKAAEYKGKQDVYYEYQKKTIEEFFVRYKENMPHYNIFNRSFDKINETRLTFNELNNIDLFKIGLYSVYNPKETIKNMMTGWRIKYL